MEIEYLRVIEFHDDGYPHIHVLFQYPSACLRIENSRFFDRALYQRWKYLWKHGLSDFQRPKYSGVRAVSYILKYLIKNQTSKTVWRKILQSNIEISGEKEDLQKSTESTPQNSLDSTISNSAFENTPLPIRLHGVKLCTWSRNFDFTQFSNNPSKNSLVKTRPKYAQKSLLNSS